MGHVLFHILWVLVGRVQGGGGGGTQLIFDMAAPLEIKTSALSADNIMKKPMLNEDSKMKEYTIIK